LILPHDQYGAPDRVMAEGTARPFAVRIECTKSTEGPLSCRRDGEPVEGEALEKLKSAFPAIARLQEPGVVSEAGEDRRLFVLRRRAATEDAGNPPP
jgi:hypothetical protein